MSGAGGNRWPRNRLTCFQQFSADLPAIFQLPNVAAPVDSCPDLGNQFKPDTVAKAVELIECANVSYLKPVEDVSGGVGNTDGLLAQAVKISPEAFTLDVGVKGPGTRARVFAKGAATWAGAAAAAAGGRARGRRKAAEADPSSESPKKRARKEREARLVEVDPRAHLGPLQEGLALYASGEHAAAADLQRLHGLVLSVADAGLLHEIEEATWMAFLDACGGPIRQHATTVLPAGKAARGADAEGVESASLCCAVAVKVMAAPNMPAPLYREELLEAIVAFVRHHVDVNVRALLDPKHRKLHRPDEAGDAADAEPSPKRGRRRSAASDGPWPPSSAALASQLEGLLSDLGRLAQARPLPSAPLLVLQRACLSALSAPGLPHLHVRSAAALAAVFLGSPDLRSAVMDDLISQVVSQTGVRDPPRAVPSRSDEGPLQACTWAVLLMIQGAAQCPGVGENGALRHGLHEPLRWADGFWHALLERLPLGRGPRGDADSDPRLVVENAIADLLAVCGSPRWPAAATMLHRLAAALGGGVAGDDAAVAQVGVELLGSLLVSLWTEGTHAESDCEWASRLAGTHLSVSLTTPAAPGAGSDATQAAEAVLGALRDAAGADEVAGSAARFLVSRLCAEEAAGSGEGAGRGKGDAAATAARFAAMWGSCCEPGESAGERECLTMEEAGVVHRVAAHGGLLGLVRRAALRVLVGACDRSRRVAGPTRAKATRVLGQLVEADRRVLRLWEVRGAVEGALHDESISVREGAINLLGKHMAQDADVASSFLSTVARAMATDPGVSVRRRAIAVLADTCVLAAGFPRAAEAAALIFRLASDPEASVRSQVDQVFRKTCLPSPGASKEDQDARAAQLSDAAHALCAHLPPGHLPLSPESQLVEMLRRAMGADGAGGVPRSSKKAQGPGQALAEALRRRVLDAEARDDAGMREKALLALHALAIACPESCVPRSHPALFLETLAPDLHAATEATPTLATANHNGTATPKHSPRRDPDSLLCSLSVIDAVLRHVPSLAGPLVATLYTNLRDLLNTHSSVPVVAASCRAICALAALDNDVASALHQVVDRYISKVRDTTPALWPSPAAPATPATPAHLATPTTPAPGDPLAPSRTERLLFVAGQLLCWGADLVDRPACPTCPLRTDHCLAAFLAALDAAQAPVRVRRAAVQAVGMLAVARPSLTQRPDVYAALESSLSPHSPPEMQAQGLAAVAALLAADHRRLTQGQAGALSQAAARAGGETLTDDTAPLARENGAGDACTVAGATVHRLWPRVRALAVRGGAEGAAVRVRALEVIEHIHRDGLLAPWEAVPPLVTLSTDPSPDVADRARALFLALLAKHRDFVDNRLMEGVEMAYELHASSAPSAGSSACTPGPIATPAPAPSASTAAIDASEAVAAIARLYSAIGDAPRGTGLRANLLQSFVRRFEAVAAAACVDTGTDTGSNTGTGTPGVNHASIASPVSPAPLHPSHASHARRRSPSDDLPFLAFLARICVALPFRKADEPLALLHAVRVAVSRRGEMVLAELERRVGAAAATSVGGGKGRKRGRGGGGGGGGGDAGVEVALVDPVGAAEAAAASVAVCALLAVKRAVKAAYGLSDARIAEFAPHGDARKAEERNAVSRDPFVELDASLIDLHCASTPAGILAQLARFRRAMDVDDDDYGTTALTAGGRGRGRGRGGGAGAGEVAGGAEGEGAGGRQRGGRGGRGRGAGRGRGRGRGGRGRGKRRRGDDDTSDEDGGGDDSDGSSG